MIAGDLYIMNIPTTVTKKVLFNNLQNVRSIQGTLYFIGNQYISAMTFFSNLMTLYGAVYLNNPVLVDARMPSLVTLRGNVSVEGCDRLCPARFTAVGSGGDDSGCPNLFMEYYFGIVGDVSVSDLPLLSSVVSRVVANVTNNVVCHVILLCWMMMMYCCSGKAM